MRLLPSLICSLILCGFVTASCSTPNASPGLLVAAAASLAGPFEAIGTAFTEGTGVSVTFSFAATGNLAEQIRNGAPFDIFASADADRVDQLILEDLIAPGSRTVFASGQLVLALAREAPLEARSIRELTAPGISRVVLANPDHAPYGRAAAQALQNAGVWESLRPRIVFTANIRQAAQLLESGNVPAGLIARSVATDPDLTIVPISEDLYDPVQHVAGVLTSASHPVESQAFLDYLGSSEAQAVLRQYGLRPQVNPER